MNILFFLTPKSEVKYLETNLTIRQTSLKFFIHEFTSVPVLDQDGHYVRSVSEGDLFRYFMNHPDKRIEEFHENIMELGEERVYHSIYHNQNMEDLYALIEQQNYIPVLDDRDIFIGIITRKKVIEYLKK